MKRALLLIAAALLGGCLEVDQHPRWEKGQYDGKADPRVHETWFHHDRLAWNAAITDRTLLQDEYRRAKPPEPRKPAP